MLRLHPARSRTTTASAGWTRRLLNPFTWLSLQFESKTRIDVLQEMIEDLLQTQATMAALNQPSRPMALLNATDMVAGQVFTFDRQTLDDICMDYDGVPVSLGVTASAAFPFAFTPVLLHDDFYLRPMCPGQRNPSLPYRAPLQVSGGPYANLESYRTARYRQSLRNETVLEQGSGDEVPPYRKPVYLRLVDGGVADNSGLTALRRALLANGRASRYWPSRRTKQAAPPRRHCGECAQRSEERSGQLDAVHHHS